MQTAVLTTGLPALFSNVSNASRDFWKEILPTNCPSKQRQSSESNELNNKVRRNREHPSLYLLTIY